VWLLATARPMSCCMATLMWPSRATHLATAILPLLLLLLLLGVGAAACLHALRPARLPARCIFDKVEL